MELTSDEALQKGAEAHKAGRFQEADRFYTAILQSQPNHPDTNYNMGVLAVGAGNAQEALSFFKTALEANPSVAQFWLSYIDALIRLNRLADAKAVFDKAKANGAKGDGFDKLKQSLNGRNEAPTEAGSDSHGEVQSHSNILDTLKLDQATKLAKKKSKEGFSEEAKRLYQDILERFPYNKKAHDGIKSLSGKTSGKTSKVQDPPQGQLAPLINLHRHGQLRQALEQATELLLQFPNSVILHNICGAANAGLDQLDAAIASYKQALKIKPDFAGAHYNMGSALKGKGDLEAAVASYKQALKIKPDFAEAYSNMGMALEDKGDLEAAIASYKQALKIRPDFAEAYYNMGIALKGNGELEAALASYKQALKIKPDFTEAYFNMGDVLKGLVFSKPRPDLHEVISSLLDHATYVRPSDIAQAAISLLKFEPVIRELLEEHSVGKLRQSLHETIVGLSEYPLLLKLMSICPLPDLEFEAVLTDIRSALLSSVSENIAAPEILRFQSVLALQCFTNEYVYTQNDKETEALETLKLEIEKTLSDGRQPSPQSVLCLASYVSLNNFEWIDLLFVTTNVEDVVVRQVLEPKEEIRLKSDIPILQEITDKVSSKVREQYEGNPYPRWVNLGTYFKPKTTSKFVKDINLRLYDNEIIHVAAPNILIAGCGTGQHPIGTASRFKDAKVLAVDLSLSSLAYAKRKTAEIGVQNIKYMQADILDLGKLDQQFDLVESAGVLHHMNDPMAGWRVLTSCLKPGGLMNIGLYSELSREHIVKIREEIKQLGLGASNYAMKSFRGEVIESDKEHHKRIIKSSDFYSLSTLRDLLFHVQEHRFTIPQLQGCLGELGLKFCGFDADNIIQNFQRMNTGADDPYDLDKWHSYEQANPYVFQGMYRFWCQKVS
jgi:tetratricopeptide (TPR) repeat protein/ubiquinone/menaquinone biosynthesis C-methylase UbiE